MYYSHYLYAYVCACIVCDYFARLRIIAATYVAISLDNHIILVLYVAMYTQC